MTTLARATANDWSSAAVDTLSSWRDMVAPSGLLQNVVAGVTVAFVALPLNIALALACGLPASVGIVSGAVVGVVGALLGGAKLQITGPEVALAPLTLEIINRHGVEGLIVATLLCGVVQVGFGLARVGRLIHMMPVPVIGGFMAAVGLLILNNQLPRLLGLPAEVKNLHLVRDLDVLTSGGVAPVIGLLVMVVMIAARRISARIPGPLIGIGLAVGVLLITGWTTPTVPDFEPHLPIPQLPSFAAVDLTRLWPEALALALLASIDSLLSAVGVDTATRARRHHSDQELVAQGVCNVVAGLIGGMPVAGAIVRSMAAVESGATTRLAPLVQSLTLLGIFAVLGHLVGFVPVAGLAGVLIVVGARLINLGALRRSWRVARFEAGVFVATALGILFTDFVAGVLIGLVMALVQLARHQRGLEMRVRTAHDDDATDSDVAIIRLGGPVFFASHTELDGLAHTGARHVVVDLGGVPFFDLTGLESFRNVIRTLRERGAAVVVAGASDEVVAALVSADVLPLLSHPHSFARVDDAIAAVRGTDVGAPIDSDAAEPWVNAAPAPLAATDVAVDVDVDVDADVAVDVADRAPIASGAAHDRVAPRA
ncbi:MAG TPA: SulP family inorganic anion transporter [Myxococcota bacterium]